MGRGPLSSADVTAPYAGSRLGRILGHYAIVVSGIVAVIGFLPAALSHGIGAEIQRPLARVVIGGLTTATVMTLLVLPVIYGLLAGWEEGRREHRSPAG